ncbi:MAG TPA: hypothetical protein VM597_33065 [Gemmataceae bacterium]|nr:hypothetical protein [Gemmataceae bacterium]
MAGLNAQSKGRRLGVFNPHEEKRASARDQERGERFFIKVCGRDVPSAVIDGGVRAVTGRKPVDPDGVTAYLEGKFGDDLKSVRAAMKRLAASYSPAELSRQAYLLYERFRPAVPEGKRGWGAKGVLDLGLIERLGRAEPG